MSHDEVEGLHELRRKRHKKKRKREESLETTWNHDFGNVSLNYSKEDSEIDGDIDVMTGVERAEGQACSSNDEESIRHKDKKAIVDSCMISNNAADKKKKKKKKKKKNRKSFLDISEETSLKKTKHEFELKMIEHRDKEEGQRMDQREHIPFDHGTENVHQRISVECVEDQASSNGEDCVKHKHKKARVDLSMVSNIGENRKKKKREKNQKSLLDISEETSLKKIKHEFESRMIEQRDKEKGQRMDQREHVAFDQGTENVHQRISVECVEDQASSNGEDCVKHRHKKTRVDLSMVSNIGENRKKKKREKNQKSLLDISEETSLKKIKHEFESKMIEHRDKEEGQRMDQREHIPFDHGTENVHQRISVECVEDQASSNGEDCVKHKHKKARVDLSMVSNIGENRKKKKREKNQKSLLDFFEKTSLKKIKHEFESKMIEQRDKEEGQRMDQCEHIPFDHGTENVHQRISVECVEDQASSNGEDCVKHKHKKARVDLSIVSNIGENRKKKKREKNQKSLLDISEETSLKKIKHEFESEMIEHRDKEEGPKMNQHEHIAFDQGSESVHQRISVECVEDQASSNGEDCVKHKHKKARVKLSMVSNDVANRNKKMKEEPIRHANVIHETWTLSKERLKELKEKGIKVKSGKWSMQELHLLQSNMDKFLENYGLQGPDDILSLSSVENEDRKYWKRFASENDFYKQLGEGIQRPLDTIVKCAKRIYDNANYKGKYTEEEVDELRRLQAIYGADWVTTGQLMGRSRMSVCRKFSTLLATTGVAKKGIWTEDELKCLKEAVHLVTNTSSDQEVPFEGISWQAVARMVKTRNKEQCRRKWLDRLCWTQNDNEKWWTKEDDFTLITRLYNSGITEECDVDWMEVKTEFKNNYSPQWLRKKWSGIKKRVPDFQQKTFEVIVDYLFHHYAVIFEAWASNDDNK